MPNALRLASTTIPLYDVRRVLQNRAQFRRDAEPYLRLANSLYVPGGSDPARGWLLFSRNDYNQIDLYNTSLELLLDDFANGPLALQNLAISRAWCVTRGIASDPSAVYLVEVTDRRGVLCNPWVEWPTLTQYNVRAPAYPGQFYADSQNGLAPWTWDGLVGDLWAQMPLLGPYPGLPVVPTSTPEGWNFPGVSAWSALNAALSYLGLMIAVDLRQSASYTIVARGDADASFTALTARYASALEDDREWIDVGSARVPSAVTVYFHRRNQYYGTEETVRRDSLQWWSTPAYSVTLPAPAAFLQSAGKHHVWSGFTVRYDIDGQPLAADVAQAAIVAQGEVDSYFANVYWSTLGAMDRVYAGALPFASGSQVGGVCWHQRDEWAWRTRIWRGDLPVEVQWND